MKMYYNIYWYRSGNRYCTDVVPFMWKWMAFTFGWIRWIIDRRVYALYIKCSSLDAYTIRMNNSLGELVFAIER